MGLKSLGYNQLTSFNGAAVGPGKGTSQATAVVIVAAGTGYAVGDFVAVAAAAGTGNPTTFQVTSIGANGAVTGLSILFPGYYATGSTPGAAAATTTRGSGTGLTVTVTFGTTDLPPKGALYMDLTAEVNDARYRDDGTAPTAGVGFLIKATTSTPTTFPYKGQPLRNVQLIGTAAGSVLNVEFFGVTVP